MAIHLKYEDKEKGLFATSVIGKAEENIPSLLYQNRALFAGKVNYDDSIFTLINNEHQKRIYIQVHQPQDDNLGEEYNVTINAVSNDKFFLDSTLEHLIKIIDFSEEFSIDGFVLQTLQFGIKRFLEEYWKNYMKE